MKTDIKNLWTLNAYILACVAILYGLVQLNVYESVKEFILNPSVIQSVKTALPYVVVGIADIAIFVFGIVPFIKSLFEEKTNTSISATNRFNTLISDLKLFGSPDDSVKNDIIYILKNYHLSAFSKTADRLNQTFEKKVSITLISDYLQELHKNDVAKQAIHELAQLSQAEITAYHMFVTLEKPQSLKRMNEIDDLIVLIDQSINQSFNTKIKRDRQRLLDTTSSLLEKAGV